jgi:hypothetical protein
MISSKQMNKRSFISLENSVALIAEPNKVPAQEVLQKYRERFLQTPGSEHNHQVWSGGYWDHIEVGMNLIVLRYCIESDLFRLPFSLSDALLVF